MSTLVEREIELLHRTVDGEATAAERAELESLLQRSPEARETLEQLRRLDAALARIERVPAPDTLRPSILRAIERHAVRAVTPRPGRLWAPTWLGYAAAFVLGGASIGALMLGAREDTAPLALESLIGTFAPGTVPAPQVDGFSVALTQVTGEFRLVDRHHIPVVEFELDAAEPVEIELECTAGCRGFRGYARHSGLPSTVRAEDGRLRMANIGAHSAAVFVGDVADGGATVAVRLYANRTLIQEQTLQFPPSDGN